MYINNTIKHNICIIDLDKKEIHEHAPKLVVINNIFFNIFTNLQE